MGTHYDGTAAEVAALDAFIKLMRAAESVASRTHAALPKTLTVAQFGVLEALLHRGPLCQSALAAKLLKSAGNLTLVVDNLERDGHVRRERAPHDRRYVTVHLTPKGRELIEQVFPHVAAAITRELSVLSPGEQATLAELCKKLGLAAPEPGTLSATAGAPVHSG
ncbi:MAG TPA: MarR family winged helix-turn-helix transcriptional regulator [Opitutaceae bacterium]